jgi:hypothetical protein
MTAKDIVEQFKVTLAWSEYVYRSVDVDCSPTDHIEDMDRVVWRRAVLRDLFSLAYVALDAAKIDGIEIDDGICHSLILGVGGHGTGLWDTGIDAPELLRVEKDNRMSVFAWAGPRSGTCYVEPG